MQARLRPPTRKTRLPNFPILYNKRPQNIYTTHSLLLAHTHKVGTNIHSLTLYFVYDRRQIELCLLQLSLGITARTEPGNYRNKLSSRNLNHLNKPIQNQQDSDPNYDLEESLRFHANLEYSTNCGNHTYFKKFPIEKLASQIQDDCKRSTYRLTMDRGGQPC